MSTLAGSILGLFTGHTTLLVGLEDGPDGALKAYVGARYKHLYVLVTDEEDKDELRRAWATGQKVLVPTPPSDLVLSDKPAQVAS